MPKNVQPIEQAIKAGLLGLRFHLSWEAKFFRACNLSHEAQKLFSRMLNHSLDEAKNPEQTRYVIDVSCGRAVVDSDALCRFVKYSVRQRTRKRRDGRPRQARPIDSEVLRDFISNELGPQTASAFTKGLLPISDAGEIIESWREVQRGRVASAIAGRRRAVSERSVARRGKHLKNYGNRRTMT